MIFYGWDGDKLVTTQYNQEKIYTLAPNSFVPLLRLTQPLNADTKTFPNTIHTYYCDHRGAPTALISKEGKIEWQAEYDVWGARLNYSKPDTLYQPIRLQGQHYDVESGLYYNRHRYYDPKIGRYINQDPIGLRGGSNLYQYPLNPNQEIDPLGLNPLILATMGEGAALGTPGGPIGVGIGAVVGAGLTLGAYLALKSGDSAKDNAQAGAQANTKAEELTKCLPATPENIKAVVAPSTLRTKQREVSVPIVATYTQMIEAGSIPPAVKIDGNVIVEGNHRMVAGLLCNKLPPVDPGFLSPSSPTYPFSQIEPTIIDWGKR